MMIASNNGRARWGISRALVRIVALASLVATSAVQPALSQGRPAIVRDAEIELLLRRYTDPILKAAGLSRKIEVVIVNDPSFNAFVSGRRIFINSGAIQMAATPNELIGVIAHEAGHLAGGHQERLRQQIDRAQTIAAIGMVLGVGATVAGAASGNNAIAQAGGGIAAGGSEFARRGLLSYQRSEETTADRSALTYLERTKQSPQGMITTFERLGQGMALAGVRVNPYTISHPLPHERVAALRAKAAESPYFDARDPAELQQKHDMARGKIAAYTQGPTGVRRVFSRDPRNIGALYGDAIATYLHGSPKNGLAKLDKLVKGQPNNAYLHEMRGEMLMGLRRPKEAAAAYAKATKLDKGGSSLIRAALAHALIQTGGEDNLRKAVAELNQGLTRDRQNPTAYQYLAMAYGQLGDIPNAQLATAEQNFHSGRIRDAKLFAERAQQGFKRGSPGWLRAEDIKKFKIK